ncbi:MAG: SDR family oxidoreductase [Pseudomonadota bacterium]
MQANAQHSAFITGGGSGIGLALGKLLAARGVLVCLADIDLAAAQRGAALCGGGARACLLDVRDADAVRTSIEQFALEAGRLDYIFNNAGIGMAGESNEIPLAAWHRIVDINLFGVLNGVLAAYPIMIKQGFGHIVNTASLAGLGPVPLLTPYAVSKHAVVGLSTSLRIEAAMHGVRVSALCPAAIETPLLDSENPAELGIGWGPDVRRYLTRVAGAPYPLETCAQEMLAALDQNEGVIVLPSRARLAWRIGRWFPAVAEAAIRAAMAFERRTR